MESLNFYTLSIRDEWSCWKSCAQSQRRNFCGIVAGRLGWKMVGGFHGMVLQSANCPKLLGRRANSVKKKKTIRRTTQRTTDFFGGMVEYCPISSRDQSRLHQFGKFWQEYSSDMHCLREEFWKEIFWSQTLRNWRIWTHQKSILEDQCRRSIDAWKERFFWFPMADGTAKLSARDCELREPTLRRDQLVGSEEMRVSTGRTNWWRWSPERLLVAPWWLHLLSWTMNLEFNSRCRRRKHSPFHWNTLMLQGLLTLIWFCHKKRGFDDYWNFDSSKHLFVRFLERIHKIHSAERKSSKRIYVVRRATDKDSNNYQTRLCMQKFWTRLFKPHRIGNKPEFAKDKPKLENAPTLRGICTTDPDDREYSILKDARRKLERPSAPAMPCERHPSIVKTSTKPKIGPEKELKTMCDCPLRAEKFGAFISADHKVLSEGWESRDNHRYVVVVCTYGQLDGIWESMWGFVMVSQHFNTSSIRDKCHRWDSVEC